MRHFLKSTIALSAFTAALAAPAFGQDANEREDEAVAQEQAAATTDVITVRGFRSSFADSLTQKRDANQVIDTITAEEIGQFPDQNIAEAIQRISGVSITRTNGEGEAVTIRGLSPTFTRVEVDGRTTTVTSDSANPERQSVLNVFASDLYNSIEVIKSPTAADVEGGIGGIVRLNTPEPLDVGELRWGLDASITDADLRDETEPAITGFYTNATPDGRFGFLISGTYEDLDRRIDKIQNNDDWRQVDAGFLADSSDPALTPLIGGWFPGRNRIEQRVGERQRLNLNAKFQFQASPELLLSLDGLYTTDEREEDRSRAQIQWRRGQLESGVLDASTGTITEATFTRHRTEFRDFTRIADITTYGITGAAEWTPGLWSIDAEVSTFSSEEDFDEWRVDHRTNRDGLGGYSLANDPRYPSIFTEAAGLAPADVDVRSANFQQRIITLEDTDFELDAEREWNHGIFTSYQFGFRWAQAEYDRKQGSINGQTGGLTYADGNNEFVLDGTFGQGFGENLLAIWPMIEPRSFYEANPPAEAFTFNDENLWTIEEATTAAYGMVNFDTANTQGWNMRGNLGVRVVQTNYTGQGRIDIDTASDEFLIDDAAALERDYTDTLPAFNFVISKGEDAPFQIRGAVTRALTRPTINEINPGEDVIVPDQEIIRGNPELEPFRAWQYDLGIEYYFGETGEGLFSVAAFYKDVENFIVADTFEETRDFSSVGVPSQVYDVETFRNGGEASISGVEVSFQTPFSFLPEPFNDFGVFANYTYTDSEFTDAFGNSFTFPGASETTYNLVGYYERGGFSSRLAYNYRDDYLIVPSSAQDGSNAEFGEEQGRLDFAARYRFENGVRVSFDVLNITEEQQYRYYDDVSRLEDLEFEGRIYSFSIGFIY
ncbi:MAG: TonB-dependent receptor [Pseudomonadota bacterium]